MSVCRSLSGLRAHVASTHALPKLQYRQAQRTRVQLHVQDTRAQNTHTQASHTQQTHSHTHAEHERPSHALCTHSQCKFPRHAHSSARVHAERARAWWRTPLASTYSRPRPGRPALRRCASVTHLYCTLQTLSTSGTSRLNSSKQPQEPALPTSRSTVCVSPSRSHRIPT